MISFKRNHFLRGPSTKTVTLGARASTYEFGVIHAYSSTCDSRGRCRCCGNERKEKLFCRIKEDEACNVKLGPEECVELATGEEKSF